MIRNSAKAFVYAGGKLLLNSHQDSTGQEYFDLPGGGQNPYETMEEAVVREVLEETGLTVEPVRFLALAEEIFTSEDMRRRFPDYCHRTMHIFLVRPCPARPSPSRSRIFSRPAAAGSRRRRRSPCLWCLCNCEAGSGRCWPLRGRFIWAPCAGTRCACSAAAIDILL